MIGKLTSGGQIGAHRSGLDMAIKRDFPDGGFCET